MYIYMVQVLIQLSPLLLDPKASEKRQIFICRSRWMQIVDRYEQIDIWSRCSYSHPLATRPQGLLKQIYIYIWKQSYIVIDKNEVDIYSYRQIRQVNRQIHSLASLLKQTDSCIKKQMDVDCRQIRYNINRQIYGLGAHTVIPLLLDPKASSNRQIQIDVDVESSPLLLDPS